MSTSYLTVTDSYWYQHDLIISTTDIQGVLSSDTSLLFVCISLICTTQGTGIRVNDMRYSASQILEEN